MLTNVEFLLLLKKLRGLDHEEVMALYKYLSGISDDVDTALENIRHYEIRSVTPESEDVASSYQLVDDKNQICGVRINVMKDKFIKSVEFDDESKDLVFTFILQDGSESVVNVPLDILDNIYRQGKGITFTAGENGEIIINVSDEVYNLIDENSKRIDNVNSSLIVSIETLNKNFFDAINTVNQNMADGFNTINGGINNEIRPAIAKNTEDIAANSLAIKKNASAIAKNSSDILKHTQDISKNALDIATVNANLVESIANLNQNMADGFNTINGGINNEIRPAIEKNASDIAQHQQYITKLQQDLGVLNQNLVTAVNNLNQNMVDGFNTINGGINNEIRPVIEKNTADIAKEIADRTAADETLTTNLKTESDARIAQDKILETAINNLETKITQSFIVPGEGIQVTTNDSGAYVISVDVSALTQLLQLSSYLKIEEVSGKEVVSLPENAQIMGKAKSALYALLSLRIYNKDTDDEVTQVEVGSVSQHLNLNSTDNVTVDTPEGKKVIPFADEIEKAYQKMLKAGVGIEITEDSTINCTLDTNPFVIVQQLPDQPDAEDVNKIFIVPSVNTGEQNNYTEYCWIYDAETQRYSPEELGKFKADVDLSGYLKKTEQLSSVISSLGTVSASVNSLTLSYKKSTLVDGVYQESEETLEIPQVSSTQSGVMSSEDKVALDQIKEEIPNLAKKTEIPIKLPNPNALTIKYNGQVAFSYDGSQPETGNFIVNAETVPMSADNSKTIAQRVEELTPSAVFTIPLLTLSAKVYDQETLFGWFGVQDIPSLKQLIVSNTPIFVKYGISLSYRPMYYKLPAQYVAFETDTQLHIVATGQDWEDKDKVCKYDITINLDGALIGDTNSNVSLVKTLLQEVPKYNVIELTEDFVIPANNTTNEVIYEIHVGETLHAITADSAIKWNKGNAPVPQQNKVYLISVIKNLAMFGEF